MSAITLGTIRFDPNASAYEARVDVNRHGRTFRYPCRVPGTPDMDPDTIALRLAAQALGMSDSPRR